MTEFDSNRSTTAWIGSLLLLSYDISAPLAGILVKKYGCRKICILGCLLAAIGFGLAAFVPNIWLFMLAYGTIGGFGIGIMYLPTIVIISEYFDSKRGLATGIADSGSGIGTFVFAPFTTWLLSSYGVYKTVLAFSVCCLSCTLLGGLMKPLDSEKTPPRSECTEHNQKVVIVI